LRFLFLQFMENSAYAKLRDIMLKLYEINIEFHDRFMQTVPDLWTLA
jgi:hypothetical protein